MNFVIRKGINKAVVLLKIIEDGRVIVIDSETTIWFIKADELSLIDGFKVNVQDQYYKINVVSFSNDGDYFATLSTDRIKSCLYSTKTKKGIANVDRHHG